MDRFQILQRVVLNRPLATAVPTMFLMNRHNELTAIYQGRQALTTIWEDVTRSDESSEIRRNGIVPFAGTWTTTPDVLLLRPVANVYREAGYREDYEYFLRIDRERLTRLLRVVGNDQQRRDLEYRFANDSLDIGLSLLESGQSADSMEYFRAGLERVPQSATGHFHLGRALLSLGKTDEAAAEFEKTLQIDPKYHPAQFQLGMRATAANQLNVAADFFRKVVEHQPQHVEAWTNLGVVLARTKQPAASVEALIRATELDPNNVQALLFLGGQWATLGRFAEASQCFRRVTELNPNIAQGYAALGQALVKMREDTSAASALRRAIELNPQDAGSRLQLAWLQATSSVDSVRAGEVALIAALDLAKQTKRLDPRVLDVLAAAYAENGQFKDAVAAIHEAQTRIPQDHPLQKLLLERLAQYEQGHPFREK